VFKAKRLQSSWCVGAQADSVVRVSDSGWITATVFADWAESFVKALPKDDPRPHLLLLDGHSSHIFNLPFIELMMKKQCLSVCLSSPLHVQDSFWRNSS